MNIAKDALAVALSVEHAIDHLIGKKPVTAAGVPVDILGAAKAIVESQIEEVENAIRGAKGTATSPVKGFADILEDASEANAKFKLLRDSKHGEIEIHQQAIIKLNAAIATLNQAIAAATVIATQADATATAIDAVITAANPPALAPATPQDAQAAPAPAVIAANQAA